MGIGELEKIIGYGAEIILLTASSCGLYKLFEGGIKEKCNRLKKKIIK